MTAKVITVAQQKGGSGKTTLAAHLAVVLAQRGQRIAAIDIDPQGSLTHWHKIREKKYGEGYTGMQFVTASGWRVGSEISRLSRSCDYIIVDSPPHTETEARTAIRNADLVVVPVQPSPTDLWATQATLDLANAEGLPVMVVLNRVTPNSKISQTIAAELPNLSANTFGNRVIFAASLMGGMTATEAAPSSPAALEVKAIAEEILTKFVSAEDQEELEAPASFRELIQLESA